MNLVLIVFAYICYRSIIARDIAPIYFWYVPREKLKDDSSNDVDWVHDLRIILVVAQKNYVLDAPLGERPGIGADADVMNVWQAWSDDYSIVQCAILYGLESGLQRRFERHGAYEMFQELKLIFQANTRVERYVGANMSIQVPLLVIDRRCVSVMST